MQANITLHIQTTQEQLDLICNMLQGVLESAGITELSTPVVTTPVMYIEG